MSIVVPAVLPSSRKDLEEKFALFAELPSVTRVQIDVVDGKFATPASWPYIVPHELRDMVARNNMLPHLERFTYEIDLMCLDVERAIESWLALGASRFTIHAETSTDMPRLLASIRRHHGVSDGFAPDLMSIGLALNIESDSLLIEPCIENIEYVQFMGIASIGKQGQPFDRRVLGKIRAFRRRHPNVAMQVDGGVSLDTASELLALGVSNLVVGSAIVRSADPAAEIKKFEALKYYSESDIKVLHGGLCTLY